MTTVILQIIVGIIFLVSGLAKLNSVEETLQDLIRYSIFSGALLKKVSYVLPYFEIILAISLILWGNQLIINIIALGIISLFLLIHVEAIIKKNTTECFCFGKLFKTRHGRGGLIQSLLLIVCILPNIFVQSSSFLAYINTSFELSMYVILCVSILGSINILMIRVIIDKIW